MTLCMRKGQIYDAMPGFEEVNSFLTGGLGGAVEVVELWLVGAGIGVDRAGWRPVQRRSPILASTGDGSVLIGFGPCRA